MLVGTATSQPNPPYGGPLVLRIVPTTTPPLSTGMSLDVLLGYIFTDSLAHSTPYMTFHGRCKNLTWSDTARYAVKYLYEMADYDPMRLVSWNGSYNHRTQCPPGVAIYEFMNRVRAISPDTGRTSVLLESSYILHVRARSTTTSIDTTAHVARTAVVVTCDVLDTIKGRVFPPCLSSNLSAHGDRSSIASVATSAGNCIQFDYRLEWRLTNKTERLVSTDSTLVDDYGNQWIQPNEEYIVLLDLVGLGSDSVYNYVSVSPVCWFGKRCTMYPIVGGIVQDPYNDFGFGANLTAAQFKAALRAKIYSITHP